MINLGSCVLRPWRAEDADSLCRHANDRQLWLNLRDRFPHPYTRADAENWIEFAGPANPLTNFAIEVDGEAAGGIGLILHGDIERTSAEIGYWLGRQHWGRGIMSAAVAAITRRG